jgi:hypothetical protein
MAERTPGGDLMTAECNYIVTDKDGKQLGRVMAPRDKANLRNAFTQLVAIYQLACDTNGWYRQDEDAPGCSNGSDKDIPTHSDDTLCDHCAALIPSDDRWRQVASRLEDMFWDEFDDEAYEAAGVSVLGPHDGTKHLINLIEELLKEEEK